MCVKEYPQYTFTYSVQKPFVVWKYNDNFVILQIKNTIYVQFLVNKPGYVQSKTRLKTLLTL